MEKRNGDARLMEAIKEMNQKLASKKKVKTTLKDCLNDSTVKALKYFAKEYDIKGFSKLKKQELADLLYENLIDGEKIKNTLVGISLDELEIIKKVIKDKNFDVTEIFFENFIRIVMQGLVYLYNQDDKIILVMPDEFIEILKDYDFEQVTKVAEFENILLKYMKSCINLYGVIDIDYFVEIFDKNTSSKLTKDQLKQYFNDNDNSIGNIHLFKDMFVHEAIISYEGELEELLKQTKDKQYKELDQESFLKYADDYFIDMNAANVELLELLNTLFKDPEKSKIALEEIITTLVIGINTGVEELLAIINEFLGMQNITDEDDLNKLIASVINVHNNNRRWVNKGFTSAELSNNANHITTIRKKQSVGRNDLCPCGSGKKYKKCCLNK